MTNKATNREVATDTILSLFFAQGMNGACYGDRPQTQPSSPYSQCINGKTAPTLSNWPD
jgi:hypothetical protein